MNIRKTAIRVVLAVIGLSALLVLIAAAWISVLNKTNGTLVSSGRKREYLLHVPKTYDGAKPTPLVISLHGAAAWPAQQMNLSRWNNVADEQGFIVVYPSGTGMPRIWHQGDVKFVSELIDTLVLRYNIDQTRIYANGFSQGGGMAAELSCALSGRIAAVGMVSAAIFEPWHECVGHRPVPMIAFHGTADPLAPYDGGKAWMAPRPFLGVPAWVASWASKNRCGSTPVDSVISAAVTRHEYRDCPDDASVVFYAIRGEGHQWPAGKPMPTWWVGPASNAVDATSRMWAFFRAHQILRK
jgi:polyhydroxybutyrate depolymerase